MEELVVVRLFCWLRLLLLLLVGDWRIVAVTNWFVVVVTVGRWFVVDDLLVVVIDVVVICYFVVDCWRWWLNLTVVTKTLLTTIDGCGDIVDLITLFGSYWPKQLVTPLTLIVTVVVDVGLNVVGVIVRLLTVYTLTLWLIYCWWHWWPVVVCWADHLLLIWLVLIVVVLLENSWKVVVVDDGIAVTELRWIGNCCYHDGDGRWLLIVVIGWHYLDGGPGVSRTIIWLLPIVGCSLLLTIGIDYVLATMELLLLTWWWHCACWYSLVTLRWCSCGRCSVMLLLRYCCRYTQPDFVGC